MSYVLRSWRDRIELARKAERRKHLTLLPSPHDAEDELPEPTEAEKDAWLGVPPGWEPSA